MDREIVVVDGMAIVHNMLSEIEPLARRPHLGKYVMAQLEWLGSGLWEPRFEGVAPCVIWCWDSKPYWRSEYLLIDDVWSRVVPVKYRKQQQPAPIHYKGGRSKPPELLTLLKTECQIGLPLKGFHELKGMANQTHGFEADDLAALVVQCNRLSANPKHITLVSRDKDWLGLLGPEVTWVNPNHDNPRRRTLDNYAATFKMLFPLGPTQIWVHKSMTGDVSDNLPNCKGCLESAAALLPVIDLFNPPEEFNLLRREDLVYEAERALTEPTPVLTGARNAVMSLRKAGLAPCIPFVD